MKTPTEQLKLAHLKISTYIGNSIGATHYYGTIQYNDENFDLVYKLTEGSAGRLNVLRAKVWGNIGYRYRVGDPYRGFDSLEQVRKEAIRVWRTFAPDAVVLVEGSECEIDPQPCLDGPPELKTRINAFVERAEAVGGYEGDYDAMCSISDEYLRDVLGFTEETIK